MPADTLVSPILSTSGLGADSLAGAKDSPQKIRDAATQFEALLVGQILKSAHEEGDSGMGAGEDQTAGSALQMADEYLARSMASRGGLGLASMISAGLARNASASEGPAPESVKHSNPAK
jgi:Rod binding domain-containing protein